MLEQSAESFWRLSSMVGQMLVHARFGGLNTGNIEAALGALAELQREAEKLELPSAVSQLKRIYTHLFEERKPITELDSLLHDLHLRISDELDSRVFLYLPINKASLLKEAPEYFGETIVSAFPDSAEDLSEAVKCFALDRFTACVFHLMRAMERSLYVLGERGDVTIVDRNGDELTWQKIVANLNARTATLPAGPEKDRWHAAGALLHNVGKTWRNRTMHPKQTYTEQEAENILLAVRSFMNSTAEFVV